MSKNPSAPAHEPQRRKWKNSRGVEATLQGVSVLKLQGISKHMEKDPKWGVRPTPPTYQEEIPGGDPETHYHAIVRNDKGDIIRSTIETTEQQASWDDYERRLIAWEGEASDRFFKVILLDGVILDEELYAPGTEWAEVYEFQTGMPVPESNVQRRYLYLREEFSGGASDIAYLMSTIPELSGLDKEALGVTADMFRR